MTYGVDDTGGVFTGQGELAGDEWTWKLDVKSGGETSRWQYVFTPRSPAARRMMVSIAADAGAWTPMMDVTYTRAK